MDYTRTQKFFVALYGSLVLLGVVIACYGMYVSLTRKCVRYVDGYCSTVAAGQQATYPCRVCVEYDK